MRVKEVSDNAMAINIIKIRYSETKVHAKVMHHKSPVVDYEENTCNLQA